MSAKEIWKLCAGWPEYEISNLGRVKRVAPGRGSKVGRVLRQTVGTHGYRVVMLSRPTLRDQKVLVHRLLAATFLGDLGSRYRGMEVNHRNGDKLDNALDNLELVTHQENCQHSYRTGLNDVRNHQGERCGAARLTDRKVLEIREKLSQGRKCQDLADEYSVSLSAVYAVKNRKSWTHI
jgi:hypothetical protein